MSDEPEQKGYSTMQIAITALGAGIVLVLIMILLGISGVLSG
jgi:hypothetical protein